MKVERWEEETDEEWAERLAEEIETANNTEISQYFIEQYTQAEDMVIINYIQKDSWTWKEHPEGPFKADQIIEWKNKAEQLKYAETAIHLLTDEVVEIRDKLEAIETQFHNYPDHADYRRFGDFYEVYEEWMFETRKILNGSEFTTKDDNDE